MWKDKVIEAKKKQNISAKAIAAKTNGQLFSFAIFFAIVLFPAPAGPSIAMFIFLMVSSSLPFSK